MSYPHISIRKTSIVVSGNSGAKETLYHIRTTTGILSRHYAISIDAAKARFAKLHPGLVISSITAL